MFCIAAAIYLRVSRFQHDIFCLLADRIMGGVGADIDIFLAHEFSGMLNAGWSDLAERSEVGSGIKIVCIDRVIVAINVLFKRICALIVISNV